MNLTELAPCVPPLGIPPLWFFAAASVVALLAGWGASLWIRNGLNEHYRQQPLPPLVNLTEAWHAHVWTIPEGPAGQALGKCTCGAQAVVLVQGGNA